MPPPETEKGALAGTPLQTAIKLMEQYLIDSELQASAKSQWIEKDLVDLAAVYRRTDDPKDLEAYRSYWDAIHRQTRAWQDAEALLKARYELACAEQRLLNATEDSR